MVELQLWIPGIPKPGGSKRGFYIAKLKRVVITDACKDSADWKRSCAFFARAAYEGQPLASALEVWFEFVFIRPKGHFKPSGEVRKGAPRFPTVRPDATKLVRSTEDALTGIVWQDDSWIVDQHATKRYGEQPGCKVTVKVLGEADVEQPAAEVPLFETFMEAR